MFPLIIEYLRTKAISYSGLTKHDLELLRKDAEYYQLAEVNEYMEKFKDIDFVSFESSGEYLISGQTVGKNNLTDLKDKYLLKGICTNSPGYIIIELDGQWEFKTIEVDGY